MLLIMIPIKTVRELSLMKDACHLAAEALRLAGEAVKPGISTLEIDSIVARYLKKEGAVPSFFGYQGFTKNICVSVNNVVIHGIPNRACILKEGDIVSIDVGAFYKGYHGDNAKTFICGETSDEAKALVDVTRECLFEGIGAAFAGNRVGDISNAVQKYAEAHSYSVVRKFVGHGVGVKLHEDPAVPNFGTAGRGPRLMPGMTIAIEPMVNMGGFEVKILNDDWTVVTADNSLSAHFEHTVAILPSGPEILTIGV